ncbi:hypothetical protein TNCV_3784901 [Trichonephila clavipes]|nr:hypothetical protein TNCV_3784901 [Trichonephila clavipes]
MSKQLLCTNHQLHNKSFGSQPWRLEQPKKKWENWSRAMLLSSSPIFWGSPRSLGCSQWIGCTAEGTNITHVQVLQQTSQVKHMATVCLFWPVHRTQTDGAHVGHLKHSIGPFLCITSIQHRLRQ